MQQKLNVYFDLILSSDSPQINKKLIQLRLPEGAYITLIRRDNEYFMPDGNTILHAADHLFIAAKSEPDKRTIEERLNGFS